MAEHYPSPKQVGITVPKNLIEERYNAGFEHALNSGKVTAIEQLRQSFRCGFRAGKLYLRQQCKAQGVYSFPQQGRMRIKAI